ncbi:hypothetical protein RYX36_020969 [Vicia faba]
MRAVQGALLVASTLQIVLGFSGLWHNVARFLSPLSAVPLVSLVGFGLYELGFPGLSCRTDRAGLIDAVNSILSIATQDIGFISGNLLSRLSLSAETY